MKIVCPRETGLSYDGDAGLLRIPKVHAAQSVKLVRTYAIGYHDVGSADGPAKKLLKVGKFGIKLPLVLVGNNL